MQPRPNISFCPSCRTPKRPNEVSCSQCGTRACPNGHAMVSRICSLCGWEDRSWKTPARVYSAAPAGQMVQEMPDARENVCPKCKSRAVFTSGRCPNCGYIPETGQYRGTHQKAMHSPQGSAGTFPPGGEHPVVQQQFSGVYDAKLGYTCPLCGAKADPRDGSCLNCGYIGSLEYKIPQQQSPGGVPPAQSAASARQQSVPSKQFVPPRDMSQERSCSSCGASISSDSKFCQRCGSHSGSGRQYDRFIPITDRIVSGARMPVSQMTPTMETAYGTEPFQDSMGTFMPEYGDVSGFDRAFPEEKAKGKKAKKEREYLREKQGFPTGLLAAIFVVAAALVAMAVFTVSQIISTPASPTVSTTPAVDKTPPVISGVKVAGISGSSAILEWTTNEKSTSQIMLCDPAGVCIWTEPDNKLDTKHSVKIDSIKLNVKYHLTVKSIDASGNEGSFEIDQTFSSTPSPPPAPAPPPVDNIPEGPEVGKRAPNFTLKNLRGADVTLSSYRGNLVVINFWAAKCGPCIAELPDVEEVYKTWTGKPLTVLAVNEGDSAAALQTLPEIVRYTFTILLDLETKVGTTYGVKQWPTTFFIDTSGVIRKIKDTAFDSKTGKADIESILNTLQ